MKRKTDATALMTRYLLGEVSEEEQLRVEGQSAIDEEYYQQLRALEDELRYDYAQGGLTRHERELFERRFMTSPAEERRVALAQAVLARTFEEAARRGTEQQPERSWWQTLAEVFQLAAARRFSFAPAAAVVVLICCAGLLLETLRERRQLDQLQARRVTEQQTAKQLIGQQQAGREALNRQLEQERSRRQQLEKEVAQQKSQPTFLAFVLTPGLARDLEGPKRLRISGDIDSVRFQLPLRTKAPYHSYRVSLQTLDGVELWSQDVVGAASAVAPMVPARLLTRGDYVIDLKGVSSTGETEEIGEYYFTVIRN